MADGVAQGVGAGVAGMAVSQRASGGEDEVGGHAPQAVFRVECLRLLAGEAHVEAGNVAYHVLPQRLGRGGAAQVEPDYGLVLQLFLEGAEALVRQEAGAAPGLPQVCGHGLAAERLKEYGKQGVRVGDGGVDPDDFIPFLLFVLPQPPEQGALCGGGFLPRIGRQEAEAVGLRGGEGRAQVQLPASG